MCMKAVVWSTPMLCFSANIIVFGMVPPCFAGAFLQTDEQILQPIDGTVAPAVISEGASEIRTAAEDEPDPCGTDCVENVAPEEFLGRRVYRIDDMLFSAERVKQLGGFSANLWTNGDVYYAFDGKLSDKEKSRWLVGTQAWEVKTKNVTFHDITNEDRTKYPAWVLVQDGGAISSSGVGMGKYEVNIGDWTDDRAILHEIGHVLGLIHEHQRSDRCEFVTVDMNNCNRPPDFCRHTKSTNITDYDFASVMHYARDTGAKTMDDVIVPLPPYIQWLKTMGLDPAISLLDVEAIDKAYP